MTDIEFPMYFSLVPNPGYNISILDALGIDGEWTLFAGYELDNDNKTWTWGWGTVNHSIEGKLAFFRTTTYFFLKISGPKAE